MISLRPLGCLDDFLLGGTISPHHRWLLLPTGVQAEARGDCQLCTTNGIIKLLIPPQCS